MPVMDGMTATRLLRERGITVPIVGVTGNALDEDIRSFVEAGANEILVSEADHAGRMERGRRARDDSVPARGNLIDLVLPSPRSFVRSLRRSPCRPVSWSAFCASSPAAPAAPRARPTSSMRLPSCSALIFLRRRPTRPSCGSSRSRASRPPSTPRPQPDSEPPTPSLPIVTSPLSVWSALSSLTQPFLFLV